MTLWQLLVTFLVGALLMYGYTRMQSGQNAGIKALKAKLEADANCLVGEARFRGALNNRAALARGVPTVAVVDETLPDQSSSETARDAPPQLSPSA